MRKIHICIIDEGLNLEELYGFHPYAPKEIALMQMEEKPPSRFSHGTICTGLLIEKVYALNILKYVSITHISISNSEGRRDYSKIISALKLCSEMDFDIISMSVDPSECSRGEEMAAFIDKMEHTVMICAAAEDSSLAYPAAFPSVIGVKRASVSDAPMIGVTKEPADGIELIVNLPPSDYLRDLSRFICDDFTGSNSVLVPQVCGILASGMVKEQVRMTKKEAMSFFSKIGMSTVKTRPTVPQYGPLESENRPPIVFFREKWVQTLKYPGP